MWTHPTRGKRNYFNHIVLVTFFLKNKGIRVSVYDLFYLLLLLCSSGMTCPAPDFVEKSFLLTVKSSLSEEGLFVVNLVSRSQSTKDLVVSRMKEVRN